MNGTKTEVRPGVWRLRVYTPAVAPNGSPIQITKTLDTTGGKAAKPGAGKRLAERELAKMVAKVDGGWRPDQSPWTRCSVGA